jgi:hypothetical protein
MNRLLLAACALALAAPAAAQTRPNRFITYDGQSWGYVQSAGDVVTRPDIILDEGPGMGFRSGIIITILTRDGQPVTEADRSDAWFVANAICEATVRRFDPRANGILLRRGGISYPGACG